MTSHLGVMMLFAACLAAVFGVLLREAHADQLMLAGKIFAGLVLGAYLLGWIMFLAF
jgi:hypothetical protein